MMKQLKALSGADLGAGYTARSSGDKITAAMLDDVSKHVFHCECRHHLESYCVSIISFICSEVLCYLSMHRASSCIF